MTVQHTETTPKKFLEPHQASSEASSERRVHHQCRRLHLALREIFQHPGWVFLLTILKSVARPLPKMWLLFFLVCFDMSSVYKEAVACKCRPQPPIAGASLGRRALKSFAAATCQGRVESLICFCCGGTHPYVEEVAEKGDIQWYQPIQPRDDDGTLLFLGRPLQEIEQLIGRPTYLSRYNNLDTEGRKLTDHETFGWSAIWLTTLQKRRGMQTRTIYISIQLNRVE